MQTICLLVLNLTFNADSLHHAYAVKIDIVNYN